LELTALAVPEPDRQPWERQKGEPARAFQAFALYRDEGLTRAFTPVAERLAATGRGKQSVEAMKRQLGTWRKKWNWDERLEAYDLFVDRRMREQRETQLMALNREHGEAFIELRSLIQKRLRGDEKVPALDLKDLTWGDAVRALNIAIQGERMAAGLTRSIDGVTMVPVAELQRVGRDLVEIVLRHVPEPRQALAIADVQGYVENRR